MHTCLFIVQFTIQFSSAVPKPHKKRRSNNHIPDNLKPHNHNSRHTMSSNLEEQWAKRAEGKSKKPEKKHMHGTTIIAHRAFVSCALSKIVFSTQASRGWNYSHRWVRMMVQWSFEKGSFSHFPLLPSFFFFSNTGMVINS